MGRIATRLGIVIVIVAALAAAHYASLDGLDGLVLGLAFDDGTEWAPSYSAYGFWRARPGTTVDEAQQLYDGYWTTEPDDGRGLFAATLGHFTLGNAPIADVDA